MQTKDNILEPFEQVEEAYAAIADALPFNKDEPAPIGLVLGSGLGGLVEEMDVRLRVDYRSLPHFPHSTVVGHTGAFLFGYLTDGGTATPVVVMQGRVHLYEGYTPAETVLPLRLMHRIGVRTLFLTNAAGGIGEDKQPGSLMLISDHIAFFVPSPLRGKNDDRFGTRFPDMSAVYDENLRALAQKTAEALGIPLTNGVYMQLAGPQFETPAEIRAARTLGADAVGMSTATEAIAARHLDMRVMAISLISNRAAGLSDTPLSHEEVGKTARLASRKFAALVKGIVTEIGRTQTV